MRSDVRDIIIFAGGMAVGSIVTWFITKKVYEKKASEEIESVERAFEKRLEEIEDEKDGALEVAQKALLSSNDYHKEDPGAREIIQNKSTLDGIIKNASVERVDYTKYSKGDIIPVSDPPKNSKEAIEVDDHPRDDGEDSFDDPYDIDDSHGIMEVGTGRDNLKDPYEIDYTEYGSLPTYEFKELYFYQGDGIVVESENSGEEIIDNPEYLFGDVLEKSGFKTNSVKTIYIRNEHISCDFEVIKVLGTYA